MRNVMAVVSAVTVAGLMAIGCTDESGGSNPLLPPSVSELVRAWRAISVAQSGSYSESDSSGAEGENILSFLSGMAISYEMQGDCWCPDTTAYATSGNRITGTEFEGTETGDGYTVSWYTTYTMSVSELVVTMHMTATGTGDVSGQETGSLVATYVPYTGQVPPTVCTQGCDFIYIPMQKGAAASELSGNWALVSSQSTYQGTMSSTEQILDTSIMLEFTADSSWWYAYDTSYMTTCYDLSVSDYLLTGSALEGTDFSYADTSGVYSETLQSTVVMEGPNLALTMTYEGEADYRETGHVEEYEERETERYTLAPYDGPVPPLSWPSSVCSGMYPKAADTHRTGGSVPKAHIQNSFLVR